MQVCKHRIPGQQTQRAAQLRHFARHHRIEHTAYDAQRLRGVVQHRPRVRTRGFVLGQRPGLTHLHVAVGLAHHGRQAMQALVGPHALHGCHQLFGGLERCVAQQRLRLTRLLRRGDGAIKIATDQLGHTAEHIAQVIRQVRVIAPDKGLLRKRGILAQRHLGHQEVAERIHPVLVSELHRVDHIASRLAHLVAPHQPPAVGEDRLWHGQSHGLEHGRPVDRVRGQDILADQVIGGRPQ